MPAGQLAQLDDNAAPVAAENVPRVQLAHETAPALAEKVPAAHAVHVADSAEPVEVEYFPWIEHKKPRAA